MIGMKFYFTGKQCKHGHMSKWYTSNRTCYECTSIKSSKNAKKNYKKHKEKHDEYNKRWVALNKKKMLDYNKKWRDSHQRERNIRNKEYRKNNPHIVTKSSGKRHKRMKLCTPKWIDHEKMKQFYIIRDQLTNETGIAHQVDHIIPIMHQLVCGLHCEHNLQVLTMSENASKSNKFVG